MPPSPEIIRFLRLDRCFANHREAMLSATETVLATGQVVGGPIVEKFEAKVASMVGRAHAVAAPSGTHALQLAAGALGVTDDWTIQLPAYTFVATAGALRWNSSHISAIDVDDHYHMRVDLVSPPRTATPSLVMPVGLFGDGLDDAEFHRLEADGHVVLEDAAQSFGSHHRNLPGGALGSISTLSFAPTKVVPCFGNMGMVLTDDQELAERARGLRRHGKPAADRPAEGHGANGMPNAVQAAQLLVLLDHHEARQARRELIATRLLEAIGETRGVCPPPRRAGTRHAWHKFVIRHAERDRLRDWLGEQGIQSQIHYPLTLDAEPALAPESMAATNARRLAAESLSLPFYPELEDAEVERMCHALRSFEPTQG